MQIYKQYLHVHEICLQTQQVQQVTKTMVSFSECTSTTTNTVEILVKSHAFVGWKHETGTWKSHGALVLTPGGRRAKHTDKQTNYEVRMQEGDIENNGVRLLLQHAALPIPWGWRCLVYLQTARNMLCYRDLRRRLSSPRDAGRKKHRRVSNACDFGLRWFTVRLALP